MSQIIIFLIILLMLMLLFIGLGVYFHKHPEQDTTKDFLNQDGDHTYYERSIIEKKEFLRKHPEAKGKLRTLRRLFHND